MSEGIDFTAMLDAIKGCLLEKSGLRASARANGVKKSTLGRYLKKVQENFEDISSVNDELLLDFLRKTNKKIPPSMVKRKINILHNRYHSFSVTAPQVFSLDQERELVEYAIKCVNHYYGISIDELRELAYQLATKLSLPHSANWDIERKASHHWYYGFMKRHPELILRTPEQTSINRVKAFCKENVQKFFQNLALLMETYHFDGTRIFNMDESGFSTVPTKIGKIIALKGVRRVGQLEGAERGTMITLALTVSASGSSIPPFFLFPRKRMQSFFTDNTPSGTAAFANGSGWMCQSEFTQFIRHFVMHVKPTPDSPVLLLLDNHASHLSIEALDLAVKNGVHILSFPPHCSHRLQPLDVSVFAPVKAYYKSQCLAWQKNNANKVTFF